MSDTLASQRKAEGSGHGAALDSDALLARASQVLAPTYARPQTLFVEGQGCELRDASGRRYLDFSSGIAVTALGHGSPVVSAALRRGAAGLVHTSNLYHTAAPIELAAELCRLSFADKVFFVNSGAEAVEGAIKFARLRQGAGRATIVTFDGAFHGRTLGALAATDRPDYQKPFLPLAGGFVKARWNDEQSLQCINEHCAAALVEPVQGEAGVRVPDEAWLRALRQRCDATGTLLMVDEVQCGLGRTGTLWAHQRAGITPDLMTLAKPLAGGLPMGAVLMTDAVAQSITPGCHGTTFGGGPLVASVALDVLREVSRPELLQQVESRGHQLELLLAALHSPLVCDVRGRGLLRGVQLTAPCAPVVDAAREQGLLVVPAGDNVIRLLPPLTVTTDELGEGVARLARALQAVESEED